VSLGTSLDDFSEVLDKVVVLPQGHDPALHLLQLLLRLHHHLQLLLQTVVLVSHRTQVLLLVAQLLLQLSDFHLQLTRLGLVVALEFLQTVPALALQALLFQL
jgi:hypothetical protein